MEGFARLFGRDVESGGEFQVFPLLRDAFSLKFTQLGNVFVAIAAEAAFLEVEIAELLLVDQEGVHLNEAWLEQGVAVGNQRGEFFAAFGEDGEFEAWDAVETPEDVGNGLNQRRFAGSKRLKFGDETFEVLQVGGVVGREKHGASGEAGFESVQGGNGFALRRSWTGGVAGDGEAFETVNGGEGFGVGETPGNGTEVQKRWLGRLAAGEFTDFAFLGAAKGAWVHGLGSFWKKKKAQSGRDRIKPS
jgi:hypothetical protein